jgi:hypothetical protein
LQQPTPVVATPPLQPDTSSLPQPTAPFSTDRPASLGAPIIQPTPLPVQPIAAPSPAPEPIPAAAAAPAPQSSSPFGTTIQPLSQRPQPIQPLTPERPAPLGMNPAPTTPSDPQAPAVF